MADEIINNMCEEVMEDFSWKQQVRRVFEQECRNGYNYRDVDGNSDQNKIDEAWGDFLNYKLPDMLTRYVYGDYLNEFIEGINDLKNRIREESLSDMDISP